MERIFTGMVGRGHQFASGQAVGRTERPSPFSASTIGLQAPFFKAMVPPIDLRAMVPGMFTGTINIDIGEEVVLRSADHVAADVDWTRSEATRIAPETFSFVHCCLACERRYYPGLIYYPHPETKPHTNRHAYDVLEVITVPIADLRHGMRASIICRADAFAAR